MVAVNHIQKIEAGGLDPKGEYALLKVKQPDGTQRHLALPITETLNLMEVTAGIVTQYDMKKGAAARTSLKAGGYEIGRDSKTGHLVLTLTVGLSRFNFAIEQTLAQQLAATMIQGSDKSPSQGQTPKH